MAIQLDTEVKDMVDFRYQTLVEMFGKEEADKIVGNTAVATSDELDDELKELVEFGAFDTNDDTE